MLVGYWLPVISFNVPEEVLPHSRLHDAVTLDDGREVPGGLLPGVGEGLHEVAERLLVGKGEHDAVALSILLIHLDGKYLPLDQAGIRQTSENSTLRMNLENSLMALSRF